MHYQTTCNRYSLHGAAFDAALGWMHGKFNVRPRCDVFGHHDNCLCPPLTIKRLARCHLSQVKFFFNVLSSSINTYLRSRTAISVAAAASGIAEDSFPLDVACKLVASEIPPHHSSHDVSSFLCQFCSTTGSIQLYVS